MKGMRRGCLYSARGSGRDRAMQDHQELAVLLQEFQVSRDDPTSCELPSPFPESTLCWMRSRMHGNPPFRPALGKSRGSLWPEWRTEFGPCHISDKSQANSTPSRMSQ